MGDTTLRPPAEAFESRYIPEPMSGCWLWTGSYMSGPSGYGLLSSKWTGTKVVKLAHRLSWELHRGPIPDGLFVCHKCDNRACVNPDHLFVGTHQDNIDDMWRKGRGPDHSGENNSRAKLRLTDLPVIMARRKAGDRVADIASDYGVTSGAIYHVCTGFTWKHAG